jgi:hypothetical protein
MSQENVELVRRGIRSVDTFWALLAEDVIWDVGPNPVPDIHGVYVGRDAVSRLRAVTGAPGTTTGWMRRNSSTQDRASLSSCTNRDEEEERDSV